MYQGKLMLGALVAAFFLRPAATFSQAAEDSLELDRLEGTWNEAHERGDAAALDRLWDADLEVAVPGMQPMTKAQALDFARSGRMRFEQYATRDVVIRLYGDAAVVTGRMQRVRELEESRTKDDWFFTKTYVRRIDGWRVVAFHASEAPVASD